MEVFMLTEIKIKPQSNSDIGFEKRDVFSDKYDYEIYEEYARYAMCLTCAYFSFSNTKSNTEWRGKNACGNCRLMKSLGAYEGVLSLAVCNGYLSSMGTDINGKPAKKLPDFVKLEKTEKGKYCFVVLTA